MELHCPVLCWCKWKGQMQILVVKRSNDRKVLPGKWEFGCAKPNGQEPILDTLKREYFEDFNIHIKIAIGETGPKPISMYEVERDGELHKGVVLLGRIEDPENIRLTPKHTRYMIDTPDEILKHVEIDEVVPGFLDLVNLAREFC